MRFAALPRTIDTLMERTEPEPNSGCWLWVGNTRDRKGYGTVYWDQRLPDGKFRRELAHRVMYTILRGPIPHGLELDHLCRVPRCVNPRHLEPVTHAVNMQRGLGIPGTYARRTHCKNGHLLGGDNARPGGRRCRRCHIDSSARYQRARRARMRNVT